MGTKGREIVGMDGEQLLKLLNMAFADEWLAYYQYWLGSKVVKGPMKEAVIAELLQHATDELPRRHDCGPDYPTRRHTGYRAKEMVRRHQLRLRRPRMTHSSRPYSIRTSRASAAPSDSTKNFWRQRKERIQ
jgi:hypothetical protein